MTVHRVTRLRLVNAYLVVEDDGLTLVDTLIPGSASALLAAAERLGAPIARVAITHAHGDHVGSVDALHKRLGQVELFVSARDARFLAGDTSLDPGEGGRLLPGTMAKIATRPTRTVAPGERIGSLEVIAAPGHTPGQLAFLDTRDRTLYCGDAYGNLGGRLQVATRPRLPVPIPALATWRADVALQTGRALRALNPARLAPGHGRVLEQPGAAMDAAIAKG